MSTTTPPRPAPPTAAQRIQLLELAGVMRGHASKVGPQHSFWEDISDMEDTARGRPNRFNWTPEMWIDEAERILWPTHTPEQLAAKVAHWRSGTYTSSLQNDSLRHILGTVPSWVQAGMTLGQIVDRWAAEREASS